MFEPEYVWIHRKHLPENSIQEYKLQDLVDKDNHIYCKIDKGMHGLKQAAILACKQLVSPLKVHGYVPVPTSNGLWKHISTPTLFAPCIDDFSVKYNSQANLQHLINAFKTYDEITVDLDGQIYCGVTKNRKNST